MIRSIFFSLVSILLFSACTIKQNVSEIEMINIPRGTYVFDQDEDSFIAGNEKQVDSFMLAKYTTQLKLYREYLKESSPDSKLLDDIFYIDDFVFKGNLPLPDDWPICYVSYYDALNFCNWLSKKEGLDPVYKILKQDEEIISVEWNQKKNGYRLPTELEWEYAASSGGFFVSYDELTKYGWVFDNSDFCIHSVGMLCPNQFGLYDMFGNIYEWCWDFYMPNNTYDKEDTLHDRVIKGGCYLSKKIYADYRAGENPLRTRYITIGFRLARNSDKKNNDPLYGIINQDNVCLRESCNIESSIIKYFEKDEKVEIIEVISNKETIEDCILPWLRICANNKQIGYVYGKFIDFCVK
ncbi:MAG: SUMF1/EgtB/PvdO family nonheme iron enzyme [Treponema sp.]|nr:SUMF1/EgtB/PvdO family nonheme iron enzyme [Treponema sp.]